MKKLSDQELFGMIPKADGSHDPGNGPYHIAKPLGLAYSIVLATEGTFPETLHIKGFGYSERELKKDMKKNRKAVAVSAYEKAFPKIDDALEAHMEETCGYIYSFPPVDSKIYEDERTEHFKYFDHAPEDYIPSTEKKLHSAYSDLHDTCVKTFRWRLFWFLMAAAGLALTVLGGNIYQVFPALGAWITESNRNLYIQFAIIILFMQIIGWYVPARRLDLTFDDHTPLFLAMLGGIFIWTVGYFLFTAGPLPESEVGAVVYHIVKWPYLAYFAGVCIFHLVYLCKVTSDLLYYCKNLPRYRRDYVQIYESEIHKLQRYLRMRELWLESANISAPYWLIVFEGRLKKYDKSYEKLAK